MCFIRVLSWNIRTFGERQPMDVVVRGLADLILKSCADVVCVQELQSGRDAPDQIGAPIGIGPFMAAIALWVGLTSRDAEAGWAFSISGLNNSGVANSMRDAYLFLWKQHPKLSVFGHLKPVEHIGLLQQPSILRRTGSDIFPGRRPGMIVLNALSAIGKKVVPFKVVSWHAATPCNSIKKNGAVSSGRGLIELATLTEIGGIAPRMVRRQWVNTPVNPLPAIDTIVLGDFNYSLDKTGAATAFANLLANFVPCVSQDGHIVRTTYSSNPTRPFENPSSYDNIFVLKAHDDFVPSLRFLNNSGAIDFIRQQAEELGQAAEIRYFATEAAWFVIFKDKYKKQYGTCGLSDHLPVWADFEVGDGTDSTDRICKTDGDNNNCLFNATLGTEVLGTYVDILAANHRTEFANWLAGLNIGNLTADARAELLSAMIAHFEGLPRITNGLQTLLGNAADIFASAAFTSVIARYITSIRNGRMLYWHEAALLAIQRGITIRLFRNVPGQGFVFVPLNPGHGAPVDIYHFGVHFFHYRAN